MPQGVWVQVPSSAPRAEREGQPPNDPTKPATTAVHRPTGERGLRRYAAIDRGVRLSLDAHEHGSHHIYEHPGIPELVNVQEVGGEAKPYQIKQPLRLVERHALKLEDEP